MSSKRERKAFRLLSAIRRIEPLPALGALIVLATFVVKDGLSEHYKDVAAAADAGRLMYQQNSQLGGIAASIDDLRRLSERQSTVALDFYDTFHQRWISYTGQIDSLKELLRKISAPQSNSAALKSLEQLNAQFLTAIQNYGQLARRMPAEDSTPLSKQSGAIFGSLHDLDGQLVGIATMESNRSERLSDDFTFASYFLYFGGWLLAVLGKAFNVRGMELPTP